MATITARSIIDKVGIVLQDTTNTRWPLPELLGWLNDGQREVVLHKPAANPSNQSWPLISGTKQSIPPAGLSLIDVVRNMGSGSVPGRAIRVIDRRILDTQRPDWHTEALSSEVKHYCFDDSDPKRFYVYPPAQPGTNVELIYSSAPADITISGIITVDDIYANALLDYILYRAYAKDADYTVNDQRVMFAYETFLRSLGVLQQRSMMDNPNYRVLTNESPTYTRGQ